MISYSSLNLLEFFETEPEVDEVEPTILKYTVSTPTGLEIVFTIDGPLKCVHVLASRAGIAEIDVGTEGVTEVVSRGKGNDEILECTVLTRTLSGKLVISWKTPPIHQVLSSRSRLIPSSKRRIGAIALRSV